MSTSPLEIRMAHLEGAYEQVNTRLAGIEERLGSLETKFESRIGRVEDRLGRLEDRFGRLEDRFTRFDDKLDARVDSLSSELLVRMDRQFYWILSLVVLAILVPIFLRLISV